MGEMGMKLLKQLEANLREDYGKPDDYLFPGDTERPPEAWKDYPLCYLAYADDREGCVREEGPFGAVEDLMEEIIRQHREFFMVPVRQVVQDAGRGNEWPSGIEVYVQPSYEGVTHTIIIDGEKDLFLFHDESKSWRFSWPDPETMAEELEKVYGVMLGRLQKGTRDNAQS